MQREKFKEWLENDPSIVSKKNGVNTRLYKISLVEQSYNVNIDKIVIDDELTYNFLKNLKPEDKHNRLQNAIRKYYEFIRGYKFPKLKDYINVEMYEKEKIDY